MPAAVGRYRLLNIDLEQEPLEANVAQEFGAIQQEVGAIHKSVEWNKVSLGMYKLHRLEVEVWLNYTDWIDKVGGYY